MLHNCCYILVLVNKLCEIAGDAKTQRKAMNDAINSYKAAWYPDEPSTQPCVDELEVVEDEDQPAPAAVGAVANANTGHTKVAVLCEDYGQSIPLPSYRANRPNVDYFNSDLHLHNFNVCNTGSHKNTIFLYDERKAGKDGNTVSSMRFKFHLNMQQQSNPPKMLITVRDNCVGQNKSQVTMMMDCLLSMLFYDRVATFYLVPGHSHMRCDQVIGLCKRSLNKKDLFLPEQVRDAMADVKNMDPEIVDQEVFRCWDPLLKKYFKPLPTGYTANYVFEFVGGKTMYKKYASTPDENAYEHTFCEQPLLVKKAVLKDLYGGRIHSSDVEGMIQEAVHAGIQGLKLEILQEKKLAKSKMDSIAVKLTCVPTQYRAYYPGYEELVEAEQARQENQARSPAPQVGGAAAEDGVPPQRKKSRPGRPRSAPVPAESNTPSIIRFIFARQATPAPHTGLGGGPAYQLPRPGSLAEEPSTSRAGAGAGDSDLPATQSSASSSADIAVQPGPTMPRSAVAQSDDQGNTEPRNMFDLFHVG